MKSELITGFSQAGLVSYLNKRQYEQLYWPTLFPVKQVASLDGKTIIGEQGSRVAAYITSYDSKAPEVSRKTIASKYFDIPKISIARRKSEKEILEHASMKALLGNDAVLEDYFNDIDFVYEGVHARMEWLALQAVSLTKFTLSTTNNPLGIINETAVDFGMSSSNKKVVAVVWSLANYATMTPITDMVAVYKAARDAGTNISRILMHPDAYDQMVKATEFQNAVKQFVAVRTTVTGFVGLDLANTVLASVGLPPVVVVNTSVGIEDKAGTVTYSNPFSSTHVVFVPDTMLGNMYSGPIAEEIEKPENTWQAKRGNILVSVQKEWNPTAVVTKGESNSFPSWPSVDKCYNMYTGHTSTWA